MSSQESPLPPVVKAPAFQNEPPTDFSRKEHRESFQQALDDVGDRLGRDCPLVIDGKSTTTRKQITSVNPSHRKQTVGISASATVEQARLAVEAARRASRAWGRTSPDQRAAAPGARGRRDAEPAVRAGRVGGVRMRQAVGRSRRRRRRGDRLLHAIYAQQMRDLAMPRAVRLSGRGKQLLLPPARRGGGHRPVELSAGDSDRHDGRGAGRRQHGRHEASRAVVGRSPRSSWRSSARRGISRTAWSTTCRASAKNRPGTRRQPATSISSPSPARGTWGWRSTSWPPRPTHVSERQARHRRDGRQERHHRR